MRVASSRKLSTLLVAIENPVESVETVEREDEDDKAKSNEPFCWWLLSSKKY